MVESDHLCVWGLTFEKETIESPFSLISLVEIILGYTNISIPNFKVNIGKGKKVYESNNNPT